ncbi:hypothetical protein SSP531S_07600 [Streptomyces spongiicola]|uniref:Uncharacterized protein n=1 Tax=Streptomyces spongiicola TaxID=1690221 RepID=A0A388SSF3_9ACTN|nr:hypothetical protein SSP531S_07600 [Streptomyces spongiicola]
MRDGCGRTAGLRERRRPVRGLRDGRGGGHGGAGAATGGCRGTAAGTRGLGSRGLGSRGLGNAADPAVCGCRGVPARGRPGYPLAQPRLASAWLRVCDGRMTAEALAASGW